MDKELVYVGLDPGVKTGIAVVRNSKFIFVGSGSILQVMEWLLAWMESFNIEVRIENPFLYKNFGLSVKGMQSRMMGAGSVQRDYKIWVEFFAKHKITYSDVNPKNILNKYNDAKLFKNATGWQHPTNSHGRDAGMMVWDRVRQANALILFLLIETSLLALY
jgi:hypothetical protein